MITSVPLILQVSKCVKRKHSVGWYRAALAFVVVADMIPSKNSKILWWFVTRQPDVHFPVLLSTFTRSRFQVKPAALLIPINAFSFWWSRNQKSPFPGYVGSGFSPPAQFSLFYTTSCGGLH